MQNKTETQPKQSQGYILLPFQKEETNLHAMLFWAMLCILGVAFITIAFFSLL